MTVKIAIVGSRDYPNRLQVANYIRKLTNVFANVTIISGGAPGVDTWAKECAAELGLEYIEYPDDKENNGKQRNPEIVTDADYVVAFHHKGSRGTAHTIRLADEAGNLFQVLTPDSAVSEPYVVRTDLRLVKIYVDGSCSPNPGIGGWGCVLIDDQSQTRKSVCGYIGQSTNDFAELTAAIEALKLLKKPCWVQLHSDSQWLINGASGANKRKIYHDQWLQLDDLARLHLIEWLWIRGHDLHPEQTKAHQLANEGRQSGN